jgi:PD-(D/E)XK nuclease superfamily protein
MDADERRSRLDQIAERIIGCVHQVSNGLGPGFLEKVYENALAVELGQAGIQVARQHRIEVRYKDHRCYCFGYYRRLSASIGGRFGLVRSVLIGG